MSLVITCVIVIEDDTRVEIYIFQHIPPSIGLQKQGGYLQGSPTT